MIEIKRWTDGKVLYTAETASNVREAVIEARRGEANLGEANLWEANLRGANLWEANLREANLWGANLWEADLRGADLREADLGGANLRGANLWGANLWGADLRGADLREADLGGANLRGANLWGANLRGAEGFAPERVNDLLILLDQVGPIRAYKLVDSEYRSPIQSSGKLTYRVGETVEAKANTDSRVDCGAGVNLATLPWCLSNWRSGYRILVCEFKRADIAAIPVGDGKFRVGKCKVVREIDQDQIYEWLGLTPDTPAVTTGSGVNTNNEEDENLG